MIFQSLNIIYGVDTVGESNSILEFAGRTLVIPSEAEIYALTCFAIAPWRLASLRD
jgi:hypothetical protein